MLPGSVQGLAINTDDIEAAHCVLVERGLGISEVQSAPWGRFSTFSELDGNGWVLQQSV